VPDTRRPRAGAQLTELENQTADQAVKPCQKRSGQFGSMTLRTPFSKAALTYSTSIGDARFNLQLYCRNSLVATTAD